MGFSRCALVGGRAEAGWPITPSSHHYIGSTPAIRELANVKYKREYFSAIAAQASLGGADFSSRRAYPSWSLSTGVAAAGAIG